MGQIRTLFTGLAMSGAVLVLWAQSSSLMIQVNPEAHLDPASIPLTFTVVNPGEALISQPITVTAWVRALPGQKIQLTAQIASLNGPSGSEPVSAISWAGTMARATGGATAATCTSGRFSGGSAQSLITGWNQSGIAACSVSFTLSTDTSWPTGTYTSQAVLNLSAQ